MNIYYILNSSFLIKTETGKRILINPTKSTTQTLPIDLILISNYNAINSDVITEFDNSKILNSICTFTNDFCSISTFNTYQDTLLGYKRGGNIIFKITTDDLTLCHLGSLGHKLNNSILSSLKSIDILFVPIGENYTINLSDLKNLILSISPNYIIPMSYRVNKTNLSMNSLDKFLKFFSDFDIENLESFLIKKDSKFSTSKKIIILKPDEKVLE